MRASRDPGKASGPGRTTVSRRAEAVAEPPSDLHRQVRCGGPHRVAPTGPLGLLPPPADGVASEDISGVAALPPPARGRPSDRADGSSNEPHGPVLALYQ